MQNTIENGETLFAEGKFNEARQCFEALHEADSINTRLLNNLGVINCAQDKLDEAEKYFQRALEIDPSNKQVLVNLGDIYHSQQRWEEAVKYLDAFIQLEPQNTYILNELAVIYLEMDNKALAIDMMNKSLAFDPSQQQLSQNRDILLGNATKPADQPAEPAAAPSISTTKVQNVATIGKKIVMLSRYDYAGSGYRIAEAINLTTHHSVTAYTIFPFEFPKGLRRNPAMAIELPETGKSYIAPQVIDRIKAIIADCDILHFKGDFLPNANFIPGMKLDMSMPTVRTVGGSFFRGNSADNPNCQQVCDYFTSLTPDLNYSSYNGSWTPVAYPTHMFKNTFALKDGIVISHSPSDRAKKGTQIIIDAVELLKRSGANVSLMLIENTSYKKCIEMKSKSHLFIDQFAAGAYGNSAIEAMALGIATMCTISDDAYAQADGQLDDCPIISPGMITDAKSLADCIAKYLLMSHKDKEKLSSDTYAWCHKTHGYEAVGKTWDVIYTALDK